MGGIIELATAPKSAAEYSSAFAIFEGGGAKGIAHLGAIRALEEEGHALIGVAGTSAGAIVAALIAVGYRPKDIFDGKTDHLLARLGFPTPVDLLGQRSWKRLKHLKRNAILAGGVAVLGVLVLLATPISADWMTHRFYGADPSHEQLVQFMRWQLGAGAVLLVCSLAFFGIWFLGTLRRGGVLESDKLRDAINSALREKLKEHYESLKWTDPVPDEVTFGDIDPDNIKKCIPLKIVVTNVDKGEMTLFENRDAHVPVADVVAASASLPIAFRPARIKFDSRFGDASFTDGGLVANLPSWVFHYEKKKRERFETRQGAPSNIPIYAFSLEQVAEGSKDANDPKEAPSSNGGYNGFKGKWRYAQDVLTTGIFGSQSIVEDFVHDLRIVKLRTKLKTIDFDCTLEAANVAALDGYRDAKEFLLRERFMREMTAEVLSSVLEELTQAIVKRREGGPPPRLRVVLIDPVYEQKPKNLRAFKVSAMSGSMDDADDRLELDYETSIAAKAYNTMEATLDYLGQKSAADLTMTKYERAMLPEHLHSVIVMPVFGDRASEAYPQRLFSLDSDDDLSGEFADPDFMQLVEKRANLTSHTMLDDLYVHSRKMENTDG